MGRPRNSPNKSERELKAEVKIAEMRRKIKAQADEIKELKKEK